MQALVGVGSRSRRERSVRRAENGPIKATGLLRQPHQEAKIAPGGLAGKIEKKEERVGGTQESKVKVLAGQTRRGCLLPPRPGCRPLPAT